MQLESMWGSEDCRWNEFLIPTSPGFRMTAYVQRKLASELLTHC